MEGDYKKYIKMYIILYNIKVGPKQSPLGTRLTKARLYITFVTIYMYNLCQDTIYNLCQDTIYITFVRTLCPFTLPEIYFDRNHGQLDH